MLKNARIAKDIQDERERQSTQWGGHPHDDTHDPHEWIGFIHAKQGDAGDAARKGDGPEFRRRMVQIAALACAAIESYDRRTSRQGFTLIEGQFKKS